MADGVTQVVLDDGTVVWARITDVEELGRGAGAVVDSGAGERVAELAAPLTELVRGVARSVHAGAMAMAPDEVEVGFGIELSARSGRVIGLLTEGGGRAALTVRLTWSGRGGRPEDRPAVAPAPS